MKRPASTVVLNPARKLNSYLWIIAQDLLHLMEENHAQICPFDRGNCPPSWRELRHCILISRMSKGITVYHKPCGIFWDLRSLIVCLGCERKKYF